MKNYDDDIIQLVQKLNDKLKIDHVDWHKLKSNKIEVRKVIIKNAISSFDTIIIEKKIDVHKTKIPDKIFF